MYLFDCLLWQKIEIISNAFFDPQLHKNRHFPSSLTFLVYQEENWKKVNKYVEIKQHANEQPVGQKKSKTFLETKMKIQYTKIYGIHLKQF